MIALLCPSCLKPPTIERRRVFIEVSCVPCYDEGAPRVHGTTLAVAIDAWNECVAAFIGDLETFDSQGEAMLRGSA